MASYICDIAVQPPSCTYRFVPLWGLKRRDFLAESGVMHCGLSEERGAFMIGRRNPDGHTVHFTRSGGGTFQSPDTKLRTGPGDLVILPAGMPHHYTIARAPWKTLWFHLGADAWPMLAGDSPAIRKSIHISQIEWLMDCYYRETLRASAESSETLWHIGEALLCYLRRELSSPALGQAARAHAMVSGLAEKIDARLDHRWSLKDMAGEVCLSTRGLMYLVKKETGTTPMELVCRLRMLRAASLLTQTDAKISTIGLAVGYGDQFAFSTAFKRFHGCAPREFRRRQYAP